MSVTADTLALQAQLDAQVDAVVDTQTRALVAAWAAAWAEVAADLNDTLTTLLTDAAQGAGTAAATTVLPRPVLARSARLTRHRRTIADQLLDLSADAGVTITADLDQVVTDAVQAQRAIIATQLPQPGDLTDTDLDADDLTSQLLGPDTRPADRALDAIVRRTTQQITARTRPIAPDAYQAVTRELVRGIALGDNPRTTAARMTRRAEKVFNGGLTRALVISRTEMLDAHRDAAAHGQDLHRQVLAGWSWLCHLDTRTCPACLVRHGTVHAADVPGPHDHPQGRCARLARTKSWADLGIDGLDGVDEPEPLGVDARAWFDALPADAQRQLLGRERLQLLTSGAVTWGDLAVLRPNEDWRESWQVRSLQDLRALAAQRTPAGV